MIPAGNHGGDGARLAAALGIDAGQVLDLSASLNPVAPDPVPVLAAHLGAIARYPDPEAATSALARAVGVPSDQLLLTNGGAEAIALVAAELGPGWVDEPDFSLYRRHLPSLDPRGPRWRSNPHNPSGLLAAPTDTAGVWDEAFWPLATGNVDPRRRAGRRGRARVADQAAGLPGTARRLRRGRASFIGRLARRQPRWSVNGLACAALPDLLATVDLATWSKEAARLREQLVSVLHHYGLVAAPSDANWVLVFGPHLRRELARQAILVRDCTSFGLPGTVRIAVPTEDGLARLGEALARCRD